MSAMSEETKNALKQATEKLAAARADADSAKRACLAQIQADLPERAAEAAKRVAIQYPDVTKELGKDGVAEMRAALQVAAEDIGRQFVAAINEIDWPLGSTYSKVENRNVHSALFKRFWKKTGALKQVLVESGYKLGDADPFLPQALYVESKFTAVAAALTVLGRATTNFQNAKEADDDSIVDDLWGS